MSMNPKGSLLRSHVESFWSLNFWINYYSIIQIAVSSYTYRCWSALTQHPISRLIFPVGGSTIKYFILNYFRVVFTLRVVKLYQQLSSRIYFRNCSWRFAWQLQHRLALWVCGCNFFHLKSRIKRDIHFQENKLLLILWGKKAFDLVVQK